MHALSHTAMSLSTLPTPNPIVIHSRGSKNPLKVITDTTLWCYYSQGNAFEDERQNNQTNLSHPKQWGPDAGEGILGQEQSTQPPSDCIR